MNEPTKTPRTDAAKFVIDCEHTGFREWWVVDSFVCEQLETEIAVLRKALAVSILGSDYGDRCHSSFLTPNKHVKTPPEFVAWARRLLGDDYDPTCQRPVKDAIEAATPGDEK
jgi:hypothetical protein